MTGDGSTEERLACAVVLAEDGWRHLCPIQSAYVSYVGFQGGAQPVYFVGTCMARNLCHELLHTLGLRHEHTRLDPDHYVTIQWGSQEKRRTSKVKKGDPQNLPYDYNSIMQYGPYFFSADWNPTTPLTKLAVSHPLH